MYTYVVLGWIIDDRIKPRILKVTDDPEGALRALKTEQNDIFNIETSQVITVEIHRVIKSKNNKDTSKMVLYSYQSLGKWTTVINDLEFSQLHRASIK